MWFLYVEGHGIEEFEDLDELKKAFKEFYADLQLEAITIIEGEDITSQVAENLN